MICVYHGPTQAPHCLQQHLSPLHSIIPSLFEKTQRWVNSFTFDSVSLPIWDWCPLLSSVLRLPQTWGPELSSLLCGHSLCYRFAGEPCIFFSYHTIEMNSGTAIFLGNASLNTALLTNQLPLGLWCETIKTRYWDSAPSLTGCCPLAVELNG